MKLKMKHIGPIAEADLAFGDLTVRHAGGR